MASVLFPDIKKQPSRDFHRDNIDKMRQKEYEAKQKVEEEKNQPQKQEWKMKRFTSVDSKVRNVPESNRSNNGQKENLNQLENQTFHRQNSRGKQQNHQISMDNGPRQNQSQKNVLVNQRLNSQQKISMNQHLQQDQYDYQIPTTKNKQSADNTVEKPRMSKKTESLYAAMQQEEFQVSRVVIYDDTKLVSIEDTKVPLFQAPIKAPQGSAKGLPPRVQNKTQRVENQIKIQDTTNIAGGGAKERISQKPPTYKQASERNQQNMQSYEQNDYNMERVGGNTSMPEQKQAKNFIKDNRQEALNPKNARKNSQNELINSDQGNNNSQQHHKAFGKVPKYLQNLQKQKEDEQEARKRQEEEAKLPPGTRLMPEDERLRTLDELQMTKREIINMLEKMPLANQSMALQKRKREMEEKIEKIDKAIETFSKKTVYVAL